MEEMIERVAKAIHNAYWADEWESTSPNGVERALAIQQARAAIEAMREPTHAMEDAGWAHMETGGPFSVFNAMIDKALSSSTRGE